MNDTQTRDPSRQVRIYLRVFVALLAGTAVTVAASHLKWGILLGIAVAILIAAVKGSLVAGYFMHLVGEHKLVYGILAFTALFFVVLMGLILGAHRDQQGQPHGIFVGAPPLAPAHSEPAHVP